MRSGAASAIPISKGRFRGHIKLFLSGSRSNRLSSLSFLKLSLEICDLALEVGDLSAVVNSSSGCSLATEFGGEGVLFGLANLRLLLFELEGDRGLVGSRQPFFTRHRCFTGVEREVKFRLEGTSAVGQSEGDELDQAVVRQTDAAIDLVTGNVQAGLFHHHETFLRSGTNPVCQKFACSAGVALVTSYMLMFISPRPATCIKLCCSS